MLVPMLNDWLRLQESDLRLVSVFDIDCEGFLGMLLYLLAGYQIGRGALGKLPTWSLIAVFLGAFVGSAWYQYYALSLPHHVLVDYSYILTLVCAAMLFEFYEEQIDRRRMEQACWRGCQKVALESILSTLSL